MFGAWTTEEEDLLVEHLELDCDLAFIADALQRSVQAVGMKMLQLYQRGALVVMSVSTYEAGQKRVGQ
ncbi:MAG: hypothetical protein ACO3NY_06810 [Poseidonia sp.]